MDPQKAVHSLKDIAQETRWLILKLKQFGETSTNLKIKDYILENTAKFEHAFKNDLRTMILNANKHKLPFGGSFGNGSHLKESNLEELQAEVQSISGVVNMLQKQINRSSQQTACEAEEDCPAATVHGSSTEDMKMDTFQICEGNNSAVTTNDKMFEESFYLSEDEDIFGEVECKEQDASNDKSAKRQINDDVVASSRMETSKGKEVQDCPYAFSEPFFTQNESVFEKCAAALSSVEYDTELFEEESGKLSQKTKSASLINQALPNSSNRITSSDEIYAEACKPIERAMYGVDSNLGRKGASVSSKGSAPLNTKSPLIVECLLPDEVPKTKIIPNNDESKRGVLNEGAPKGNAKTRFESGRFSARECPSDELGGALSSVLPSIKCLTRDTNVTIDRNTSSTVKTTTTSTDKLWTDPLLKSLPDDLLKVENVFNLPIHLQRPDWVLTVSGRLSKSQNVMLKVQNFASVLKCKLRTSFNFLTTHLILNKGEKSRQIDFYEALVSNRPVVSYAWISESLKEGKLLSCDPFLIWKRPNMDDEDECCDVQDFLLEDFHICCIASFSGFSKGELRRLVEMCGGTFVLDPALFKCSRNWKNVALVEKHVFNEEYEHQYKRANENLSKFEVVSKEWLLDSISQGRLLDTRDFLCSIPSFGS